MAMIDQPKAQPLTEAQLNELRVVTADCRYSNNGLLHACVATIDALREELARLKSDELVADYESEYSAVSVKCSARGLELANVRAELVAEKARHVRAELVAEKARHAALESAVEAARIADYDAAIGKGEATRA
jgi:uridine phosphorylase